MKRLVLSLLLVVPLPLSAQTPETRMRAFLREILRDSREGIAEFFPRRGEWSWVASTRLPDGRPGPAGAWRFPAADTRRAIGLGGPVCAALDQPSGEFGSFEGELGMRALADTIGWRRVGASRFVPPGEADSSPAFVEWRREDGRWVISSFGDTHIAMPPGGVRPPKGMIERTTRTPPPAYAGDTQWYRDKVSITFEGTHYLQYGIPRPIPLDTLTRIGLLGDVAVYTEKGDSRAPSVIYVATGPAEFQPYQGPRPQPCQ